MSTLQDKYQFLYESDLVTDENKFIGTGTTTVYIPDNNSFSYNSGIISWNGVQLQASNSSNRMLEIKDGYLIIPFGCTVTLDAKSSFTTGDFPDGTKKGKLDPQIYKNTISCKGWHHAILDQVRLTYGKVIITGNQWHNIFVNERLKRMTREQNRMFGDFANINFDSHDSMKIDAAGALEENNNFATNQAHKKRCDLYNTDLLSKQGPLSMYDSATINDCFEGGLIAAYDISGAKVSDVTGAKDTIESTKPITTLVFQYIGYLPLSFISPVFEKMPSISSIPSMELRITTNLSVNSVWTVTYDDTVDATTKKYKITGTSAVQGSGSVCPFLLSPFSSEVTATTGIGCVPITRDAAATTEPKASVVPYIGYYQPADLVDGSISSNGKMTLRPNAYPCRIAIPSVAYNAKLREVIYKQPASEVLYEDFAVDASITNRVGGSSVQHQLQNALGRVRRLYIIPYFVSKPTPATFVPVYQSLVSSAPTTCSPCKLTNFMVSLSSVNVFAVPVAQSHEFFINNNLISQAQINGNSFSSAMVSGQVPFSQWASGSYQVYEVLLDRAIDQIADNENPTIQVSFKINAKADYAYNFVLMTTFQSVAFIDRVDGSVSSGVNN